MSRLKTIVRNQQGLQPLRGGHSLCQGCGIPMVVRTVLSTIQRPAVVVNATGCLEVATTRFPDLIHALEHLRVPMILTTIIAFLYRYLFVLGDEVFRLMRARESRSEAVPGQRSGRGIAWRAQVAGNIAGQLFLRSYERSDRVYNAMLARGFTGHMQTINPHELRRVDYLTTALVLIAILLLQLVGRL